MKYFPGLRRWTLHGRAEDHRGYFQLRPVDLTELVWEEILHSPSQPGQAPSVQTGHYGEKLSANWINLEFRMFD